MKQNLTNIVELKGKIGKLIGILGDFLTSLSVINIRRQKVSKDLGDLNFQPT